MLTYVSFRLLVRGEYDVTPDHQPLLGEVDDGLYVAAGFSGHGFMIAPAVARILADAILGGALDEALTVLDAGAFRGESPRARAPAGLDLGGVFLQLLANGLVTGSVIAIAAVGVSIVYGILRLVNFAYGDLMAFGALAAYAFNGPLGIAAPGGGGARDGRDRGALARCSTLVLWRPLRAQRAGFMSLFLASIGLALVLRAGAPARLRAAVARPTAIDPYKVYVIGSVRLSQAPGRRRSSPRPSSIVARRALPRAHDARSDDARARRRPGARRDRGYRRRPDRSR